MLSNHLSSGRDSNNQSDNIDTSIEEDDNTSKIPESGYARRRKERTNLEENGM